MPPVRRRAHHRITRRAVAVTGIMRLLRRLYRRRRVPKMDRMRQMLASCRRMPSMML
jgi:hypothetical protein